MTPCTIGSWCADFEAPTWCDSTPHVDWRAAAYERAATRPCAGFWWNTKPHMHPWIDRPENGARCQPSAPVAR